MIQKGLKKTMRLNNIIIDDENENGLKTGGGKLPTPRRKLLNAQMQDEAYKTAEITREVSANVVVDLLQKCVFSNSLIRSNNNDNNKNNTDNNNDQEKTQSSLEEKNVKK